MIARVRDYSATVSAPDIAERNLGGEYEPLLKRICTNGHDLDEIIRQMRLIMKGGAYPLITVFIPRK